MTSWDPPGHQQQFPASGKLQLHPVVAVMPEELCCVSQQLCELALPWPGCNPIKLLIQPVGH